VRRLVYHVLIGIGGNDEDSRCFTRQNIGVGVLITLPVMGCFVMEPQFVHGPAASGANSKVK